MTFMATLVDTDSRTSGLLLGIGLSVAVISVCGDGRSDECGLVRTIDLSLVMAFNK